MNYLYLTLIIGALLIVAFFIARFVKNGQKAIKTIFTILFIFSFAYKVLHRDAYFTIYNLLGVKEAFDSGYELTLYTHKYTYILIYVLRLFVQMAAFGILAHTLNKKQSHLKAFKAFIALPVYLLAFIFIEPYSISIIGTTIIVDRLIILGVEIASALILCLLDLHDIRINNIEFSKLEMKRVLWSIPAFMFLAAYNTNIQNLIGNQITDVNLSTIYRTCLVIGPIICLVVAKLLLRKRNQEDRNFILFLLSMSLLIKHWYYYPLGFVYSIPLNLCHFGINIVFLSTLLKNRYLATFTLFISTLGAIIALVLPLGAPEGYLTAAGKIHYLLDHSWLLILPHLIFRYGEYKKPTIKDCFKIMPFITCFWFLVCVGQTAVQFKNSFVSWVFFNESTLTDLFPFLYNIKNNFVITFNSLSGNIIHIYYLYWLAILLVINLMTFVGFGIWKLMNLRCKNK